MVTATAQSKHERRKGLTGFLSLKVEVHVKRGRLRRRICFIDGVASDAKDT
jgi:hypothetical protein